MLVNRQLIRQEAEDTLETGMGYVLRLANQLIVVLAELEQAEQEVVLARAAEDAKAAVWIERCDEAQSRLAKVPALVEALSALPYPLKNGNHAIVPDSVLERARDALAAWESE